MRDPVTTTSCNSGAGSVEAAAVCENAAGAAAVAPAIAIAARIAYCNLRLFPICCSLQYLGDSISSFERPRAASAYLPMEPVRDVHRLQHANQLLPSCIIISKMLHVQIVSPMEPVWRRNRCQALLLLVLPIPSEATRRSPSSP